MITMKLHIFSKTFRFVVMISMENSMDSFIFDTRKVKDEDDDKTHWKPPGRLAKNPKSWIAIHPPTPCWQSIPSYIHNRRNRWSLRRASGMDVPMAPWSENLGGFGWVSMNFWRPQNAGNSPRFGYTEVSESILHLLHDDPGSSVFWNLKKWVLLWRSL